MPELAIATWITGAGLVIGMVVGATARAARFCTFGAIEDLVLAERSLRLRSWMLATAVATVLVTLLHAAGLGHIEETSYLDTSLNLAGAVVGGLAFGVGMSLAGTCGYGILVRTGGGDLKAFSDFLVLGLAGYMAARGLTGALRIGLFTPLEIDMSGAGGQGLQFVAAWLSGLDAGRLWLVLGLAIGLALAAWCLVHAPFRRSRRDLAAGVIIGAAVAAGFAVTGEWGALSFTPIEPQSLTYVLPPGETLVWLATFTGSSIDFAIAVVLGTLLGSFLAALARREFRWEGFDDMREMRRHLVGAFLLGTGGVVAGGCTIGQGVTGASTLSLAAPVALASMILGAFAGLYWMMTGSVREGFEAMRERWFPPQ